MPPFDTTRFKIRHGRETLEAEQCTLAVPARSSAGEHAAGGAAGSEEKIRILFTRFFASGAHRASPLVFLTGGPGESTIRAMQGRLLPVFLKLREAGDVILLEARSVGVSEPHYLTLPADWPPPAETFASRDAMVAQIAEECAATRSLAKRAGVDFAALTAPDIVRDIDCVREALEVERVNLWGYSFGAHVAMAALRSIPDRVDRVVLSGLEGPDHTFKMPSSIDAAFMKLADLAAHQRGWRGFDLAGAVADTLQRLERRPIRVDIDDDLDIHNATHTVGPFAVQYMITRLLTDRRAFGWLPLMFSEASESNFDRMTEWLVRQWRRRPGNAIYYISDAASGATAARWARIREEAGTALLGDAANFPFPEINEVWQAPDLGDTWRATLETDRPVLCISGTLDSNTPADAAEDIRRGFRNSHHLIVENAAHNELVSTKAEQEAIVAFLRGEDVRTARASLPVPEFFVR